MMFLSVLGDKLKDPVSMMLIYHRNLSGRRPLKKLDMLKTSQPSNNQTITC